MRIGEPPRLIPNFGDAIMPARSADGILRTEPIMQTDYNGGGTEPTEINGTDDYHSASYTPPAVATDDEDVLRGPEAWKNWVHGTLDNERAVMMPFFEKMLRDLGDELLDLIEPRLKKIAALELQLAGAIGALDVLRGKGVPGTFAVKGTFDPGAVYNHLDVVCLGGSSFVARRDNPRPCPGVDWQLVCGVGRRGARGERGAKGDRGEIGLTGAPALELGFWRVDAAHYTATPVMSDGSLGPPLELRWLFEQFFSEINGK